jgi:hypothetical protein
VNIVQLYPLSQRETSWMRRYNVRRRIQEAIWAARVPVLTRQLAEMKAALAK